MPKRYPSEQRERATRMALDRLEEYGSAWAVAQALGPKLGVGPETLRKWVLQAQTDAGRRSGPTSEELAEIKALKKKNAELREANETSHALNLSARVSFAAARGVGAAARMVRASGRSRPSRLPAKAARMAG